MSYLLLILAAAAWGVGTVISKHAVAEFPPLTLLSIQLAASLVGLALVTRVVGSARRDRLQTGRTAALTRLGLLNPGLAYALSLLGLASISASLSVLLWALEPLLILTLAAVVLGERLDRTIVALSVVAAAGMVVVLYDPGGTASTMGVVLTVAGVACCAIYTIAARRWLAGTHGETTSVVIGQQIYALGFAAIAILVVALAGGQVGLDMATPLGWASAIASGLIYYAAAYGFYLSALRTLPAATAAASFFLIPVFGIVGARLLLDEHLSFQQLLGALVVVTAVAMVLRRGPVRMASG